MTQEAIQETLQFDFLEGFTPKNEGQRSRINDKTALVQMVFSGYETTGNPQHKPNSVLLIHQMQLLPKTEFSKL